MGAQMGTRTGSATATLTPPRQGTLHCLSLLVMLLWAVAFCHGHAQPSEAHASTLSILRHAARKESLRAAFRKIARADLMRVRAELNRQGREGRERGEGEKEGEASGPVGGSSTRILQEQAGSGSVLLDPRQCAALRDLNSTMHPSNWAADNQSRACSSWPGTACSLAGSVLSLSLQGASGILPPSLVRLSQLSSLSFSRVNFTQSLWWDVPAMPSLVRVSLLSAGTPSPLQDLGWMSSFSALRSLTVNSGFEGVLPDELSMLHRLLSLNLSSSGLEILPHWLPHLSQLRVLDLAQAKIYQSIPAGLGMLLALERLDMRNNLLWGPIPLSLFNLTRLTYLDLSSNSLAGTIPSGVSALGLLTSFDLHNNSLTGPIPSQCFQLSALRHLHLDSNNLRGPLPGNMGRATSIEELTLAQNPLGGGFPEAVVQLRSLSVLRLGACQLGGTLPQEVSGLQKLHILGLGSNNLSGILAPLANALDLHYLGLQNNSFHGAVPDCFSRLQMLEYAVLSYNRLSGSFPDSLLGLPALKLLNLAHNNFSGMLPEFRRWAGATMDLSYNSFSGPIPSLNQVPNISFVNFAANNLSGPLNVEQLAGLTGLVALELSHNQLTGAVPDISTIPGLRYVDLGSNRFTGWELRNAVSLLNSINLSNNQIAMELPESITLLRSLSNLVLSGNQFWGELPDAGRMPPLTSLVLDYNAFIGTFPSTICGLQTLQAVSLRGNGFYGRLPTCVYSLSSVSVLDLGKNAFFGDLTNNFEAFPRVLAVDSNYFTWDVPLFDGGKPFCPTGVPPPPQLSNSWYNSQQPANDGAHPGEDGLPEGDPLGLGIDVDDLYLYGPLYTVASSLANNCLQLPRNQCAPGVPYEQQRPEAECLAVCSMTAQGEVCGGSGMCVPVGGSLTTFTCECIQDYVLGVSETGDPTCVDNTPLQAGGLSPGAIVGIAVGSALALGLLIGALFYLLLRPKRRQKWADLDVCHEFSLREVEAATEGWSAHNLLGEGGYGMVYKGKSPKGELWAVKRAKLMTNDFETEVRAMASLHHTNLVRLLGFCLNYDVATGRQEQILVYEFVPHGDLEKMLFDKRQSFSLAQRIGVAIGAAEGLAYLHSFTSPIVHRDVKPSNILLEEDPRPSPSGAPTFHAKIADFGLLKKLSGTDHTRVAGTPGFVDPDYNRTKIPTPGCDVYSFGVVLLELIMGQPATSEEGHIVETVKEHFEAAQAQPILDPRLQAPDEAVLELTLVAMDAVRCPAIARPSMATVATRLRVLQAKYEGQMDACEVCGSDGCVSSSQSGTGQPGSVSGRTPLDDRSPV